MGPPGTAGAGVREYQNCTRVLPLRNSGPTEKRGGVYFFLQMALQIQYNVEYFSVSSDFFI
jgi:hypothetical protein